MTTPQHSTAASAEEAMQGRETHARRSCGPDRGVKAGVWKRMLSALANGVEVHGSCDGRISLYPAAPIRLATLLHAWTYRAGRMGLMARTAEGLWPICEAVPQSRIRPARRAPKGASELVYVQ